MKTATHPTRRQFIKTSGCLAGGALLGHMGKAFANTHMAANVPVYAHLWVYASRYPPHWDCTPVLDDVFSDLKYAGIQGVELMEVLLQHDGAVARLGELIHKHKLPVTGTSYYGNFWNKAEHQKVAEEVALVAERLQAIGGTMLGITVGDAGRAKTEDELDAQADLLKKIMPICAKHGIEPNLHNHTFEVANGLHDLKGTLARIPHINLGPDLNWLVRGGVDPVWFIHTYGHQMVYMHLRDQDAQGKWTETVGEGVTDFKAIARALQQINYKGKAAIELAFDKPPVHPLRDDWKKSRQYVKSVFGW